MATTEVFFNHIKVPTMTLADIKRGYRRFSYKCCDGVRVLGIEDGNILVAARNQAHTHEPGTTYRFLAAREYHAVPLPDEAKFIGTVRDNIGARVYVFEVPHAD